jgi:hypothetical protein
MSRAETNRRYNRSEKGRARNAQYNRKRRSDPNYRREHAIYMIFYRHRRKAERYVGSGLVGEGFARR